MIRGLAHSRVDFAREHAEAVILPAEPASGRVAPPESVQHGGSIPSRFHAWRQVIRFRTSGSSRDRRVRLAGLLAGHGGEAGADQQAVGAEQVDEVAQRKSLRSSASTSTAPMAIRP
jgi:hypothetical protein